MFRLLNSKLFLWTVTSSVLLFISCSSYEYQINNISTEYYDIGYPAITEDPEYLHLILPYKDSLSASMNEVLGVVKNTMTLGRPESTLGNWISDIIHLESELLSGKHIHFSLLNYGGVRLLELPEGPITAGRTFELLPFPNEVVIISLTGAELKELFQRITDQRGWPVSEAVEYTIWNGKPFDIEIEDKPIHPDSTYRMATSDYVANGGDGFGFLKRLPRESTGLFIRDMLIGYLRKNKVEHHAIITGRINLYDE